MVVSNVNSRPIGVVAELNGIAKIHKYKRLHEGHRFIPMAIGAWRTQAGYGSFH
jgi:hypothetical protein